MVKIILYILLASLALTPIFACLSAHNEFKVIATWKQSDEINYSSFDPYYLSVVAVDRNIPFNYSQSYFIYVGTDSEDPTYGHMIDYSFHPGTADTEYFIKQSKVEWSTDDVIFRPPSGHELKIPKQMFIGGR